jgi:hypothetical protein
MGPLVFSVRCSGVVPIIVSVVPMVVPTSPFLAGTVERPDSRNPLKTRRPTLVCVGRLGLSGVRCNHCPRLNLLLWPKSRPYLRDRSEHYLCSGRLS